MEVGICATSDSSAVCAAAGYDYVELPVAVDLDSEVRDDASVGTLAKTLNRHGIGAAAFNVLLPGRLPCVGPNVDADAIDRYFKAVFRRVRRLAGEVVVFGSGRSRSRPDGFTADTARRQLLSAFRSAGDHAAANGVTVVIEPLNRSESNMVNSVAEAVQIAKEIDHPAVRVLSDLYHVEMERQPFSETADAGALLKHVHVAGSGRRAPIKDDHDLLSEYFRAVKAAGYDGRVSIECNWIDLSSQAEEAVRVVRRAWDAA